MFYRPLSARGLSFGPDYLELLPGPALRPYVHCFWGTAGTGVQPGGTLVVPDTCVDLLFEINYTRNRIDAWFCPLDDQAHWTPADHSGDRCALFGIRFFAWTLAAFCPVPAAGARALEPEALFPRIMQTLTPRLFELDTLEARAAFAEGPLLQILKPERLCPDVRNALDQIIAHRGTAPVGEAAASVCLSPRQLERLFRRELDASPKRMQQLIRHQMVFRDLLAGRLPAADLVERYGYADQSHLLRDFRRFHLLSPAETLAAFGK